MILMASGEMCWVGEGIRRAVRYDLTAKFISLKYTYLYSCSTLEGIEPNVINGVYNYILLLLYFEVFDLAMNSAMSLEIWESLGPRKVPNLLEKSADGEFFPRANTHNRHTHTHTHTHRKSIPSLISVMGTSHLTKKHKVALPTYKQTDRQEHTRTHQFVLSLHCTQTACSSVGSHRW